MIEIRTAAAAALLAVVAFGNMLAGAHAATCSPISSGPLSLYGPKVQGCTFPPDTEVALNLTNADSVNLVTGSANGIGVQFTSTKKVDAASGNATIKPDTSQATFSDLTFSAPGYTFTDFLFNVQLANIGSGNNPATTPLTVQAFGTSGLLGTLLISGLAPNTVQEFGLFSTTPMLSVLFSSTFNQAKNFAVSGLARAPSAVPLPAAAFLLMSGLAGLVVLSRRRRKTTV